MLHVAVSRTNKVHRMTDLRCVRRESHESHVIARTLKFAHASLLCLLGAVVPLSSASSQLHHEVVPDWPALPAGHSLGLCAGVGVDSQNRVFVFHRCGRKWQTPFPKEPIAEPTVSVIDGATGKLGQRLNLPAASRAPLGARGCWEAPGRTIEGDAPLVVPAGRGLVVTLGGRAWGLFPPHDDK